MTLNEFQTYLHSLYKADGSTPSSGSDEWTHRRNLLYAAINLWDSEKGVFWNELWVTLASAADGDKTAAVSDLSYDMPTDFRFLGSYVRVTSSAGKNVYYRVISPSDAELYANTSTKAVYVTGNVKTGFDLHFLDQPTAGDTINYPYYKTPSLPSATSDVIEMADPWFGIYYALSVLHSIDGDGDLSNRALAMAQDRLSSMKIRNMQLPNDQTNKVDDREFKQGFGGFGNQAGAGLSRYGDQL